MKFLDNVRIDGADWKIMWALQVADEVYKEIMGQEVTITSIKDSDHETIVHYLGLGGDCRTRKDNGWIQWSMKTKRKLARAIEAKLTKEFDVVISKNCIHIEFDPRGALK